jgi:hypothetical protein
MELGNTVRLPKRCFGIFQNPFQIDDLFSMVTKEVRLVTNNAQRPYKYASLESIVCLTGACGTPAPFTPAGITDIVQQAKLSEAEELQIALATNEILAIETYLRKYPDGDKNGEIVSRIAALKRSEYTEWTLFDVGDKRFPQYMRLSSVDPFNNRVSVQWKFLIDPSSPLTGENQHKIDGGVYTEDVTVVDCKESQFVLAERTVVNQSNEAIYHYKWSDPHFSDFSIGARFIPGSVMFGAQNILCHEELRTPLLQKADLALTKFKSLASTNNGDGEIFYIQTNDNVKDRSRATAIAVIKYNQDHSISEALSPGTMIANPAKFRFMAQPVQLWCTERKLSAVKMEYYDSQVNLVYMTAYDITKDLPVIEFSQVSPLGILQRTICNSGEAPQ